MREQDPISLNPDLLLQNAGWLRGLAMSLVGPHGVDDLVQQTWLEALRSPPRNLTALPAWLHRVMRNLVYRKHRDEQRRLQRETRAAHGAAGDCEATQLVEEIELKQTIVEAVLALREPYRTAIIYRYYRDLSPREISERMGVPLDTVQTRIRRAHHELRAKLAKTVSPEDRDLRLLLLPLLATTPVVRVAGGSPLLSLLTKGLLMNLTVRICLFMIVLLLVGIPFYDWKTETNDTLRHGEAEQIDASSPTTVQIDAMNDALNDALNDGMESAPEFIGDAQGGDLPLSTDTLGTLLFGQVVDDDGVAVSNVAVTLRNEAGVLFRDDRESPGYSFTGVTPGAWRLRGRCPGWADLDEMIQIEGGDQFRHDAVMLRNVVLEVHITTPSGEPFTDFLREQQLGGWGPPGAGGPGGARISAFDVIAIATEKPPGGMLPLTHLRDYSRAASSEYRDPQRHLLYMAGDKGAWTSHGELELRRPLPTYVSALFRHIVLDTQLVKLGASEVTLIVDPHAYLSKLASVQFRPVDAESGKLVENAMAYLSNYQKLGGKPAKVKEGKIDLDRRPPGVMKLEVLAKGYSLVHRTLELGPGQRLDLGDVRLSPALQAAGTVRDSNGNGIAFRLRHFPLGDDADFLWYGRGYSVRTSGDGSFLIDRLQPARYLLLNTGNSWARSPVLVDTSRGSISGLDMVLEPGTPVTVEFHRSPQMRFRCTIRNRDGLPAWATSFPSPHGETARFQLREGTYDLEVVESRGSKKTRRLIVGREPVLINVPLD